METPMFKTKLTDRYVFDTKRVKDDKGYLLAPASIARIGIQQYTSHECGVDIDKPNRIINVMRKPEDVFAKDSLAAFKTAVLTNDHPEEAVTAENAKELSIGFIDGPVTHTNETVDAELVITDATAIREIDSGKEELSVGYSCDLVPEKGSFEGKPYEYIQTNILPNHVALVDKGRAGHSCSISDSAAELEKLLSEDGGDEDLEDGKLPVDLIKGGSSDDEKVGATNEDGEDPISSIENKIMALQKELQSLKGMKDMYKMHDLYRHTDGEYHKMDGMYHQKDGEYHKLDLDGLYCSKDGGMYHQKDGEYHNLELDGIYCQKDGEYREFELDGMYHQKDGEYHLISSDEEFEDLEEEMAIETMPDGDMELEKDGGDFVAPDSAWVHRDGKDVKLPWDDITDEEPWMTDGDYTAAEQAEVGSAFRAAAEMAKAEAADEHDLPEKMVFGDQEVVTAELSDNLLKLLTCITEMLNGKDAEIEAANASLAQKDEEMSAKQAQLDEMSGTMESMKSREMPEELSSLMGDSDDNVLDLMDNMIEERIALIADASKLVPEIDAKGKSLSAIKREVVQTRCPELTDEKLNSVAYIDARFDTMLEIVNSGNSSTLAKALSDAANKTIVEKEDAKPRVDLVEQARKDFAAKSKH